MRCCSWKEREGTIGRVRHTHNILSKIINRTDLKCSCKEWSTHGLDLLNFGLDPVNHLFYVLSFLHAAFDIAAICRYRMKRIYESPPVHLYLVELMLILFITLYSLLTVPNLRCHYFIKILFIKQTVHYAYGNQTVELKSVMTINFKLLVQTVEV